MAKLSAFLNQQERDFIAELNRILPHLKTKQVGLNDDQYRIFLRICKKAELEGSDAHDFIDAGAIDQDQKLYRGFHIFSLAQRRRYRKKDTATLDL